MFQSSRPSLICHLQRLEVSCSLWQRTDLSRRWRPLQVLPAHCLCSCQRKASSRSKALRSSCRHRCLSRRRRSFESQATVRATDSQIWGPSEEPQVAESQPARADSGSLPTQPDPPCLPASSEDVLQTATPARPELPGSRLAASVEGLAAAHYGRKLHLNSPPMVAKKPSAATSALKRPASACTPCKGTPVVEDGRSFDSPAPTGVQASPWSLFRKSADTGPLDERPVPGSPKTPAKPHRCHPLQFASRVPA